MNAAYMIGFRPFFALEQIPGGSLFCDRQENTRSCGSCGQGRFILLGGKSRPASRIRISCSITPWWWHCRTALFSRQYWPAAVRF